MRLPKGLRKTEGGTFYVRVRRGHRDRRVAFGRDEEIARRLYRDWLYRQAGCRDQTRTTLSALADQWLAVYVATARNAAGQKLADARVKRYLDPAIGWKIAARVTADDLRSYRLWLEGQGISAQTVAHVLSDARCLLGWAFDEGYIGARVTARRLLPRIPARLPDTLTAEEVAKVTALPDPHGFVCRLGLATGLRWGDLTRARVDHVRDGRLEVEIAKTGDVRRVLLRPEILAELRGRVGRLVPFSASSKGSFARYVRDEAGLSRFHVHQLRHTCATTMLAEGWPLAAVQEHLGHASIVTTQRYARMLEGTMRAEAQRRWG